MQDALPTTNPWSQAHRFGFRLAFVYLVLYNFPFPLGAIPHTFAAIGSYDAIWHKTVPWFGKHILHLKNEITNFTNGSTDTTYDFVRVLVFVAIAFIVAFLWSILDHSRPNYTRLNQWLLLYVRLSLGSAMLSYGAGKIFQQQFADPNWYQLIGPAGENSPYGLLWLFMGASHGYRLFTGSVELLGGILLFVPRLRTLGAIIAVAAFTNVFALNVCYNVPVKLYSLHYLSMSIFLLLPDAERLLNFVLLNRAAPPADSPILFQKPRRNIIAVALQVVLGLFLGGSFLYQAHDFEAQTDASRPPFFGIWKVEDFTIDGKSVPPLLTDETRWQHMIVQYPDGVGLQSMSGDWNGCRLKRDMEKKTFVIDEVLGAKRHFQFSFSNPNPQSLTLDGTQGERAVHVQLHRVDEKEFALISDHFQWIHEDAYY
jgi:uncharacterized membrane protein YphA (DoxX/SURF4 family)